jgi:hypothetical protein
MVTVQPVYVSADVARYHRRSNINSAHPRHLLPYAHSRRGNSQRSNANQAFDISVSHEMNCRSRKVDLNLSLTAPGPAGVVRIRPFGARGADHRSNKFASNRPKATGTPELDDAEDAVVGPLRSRASLRPPPRTRNGFETRARSAGRGSTPRPHGRRTAHDPMDEQERSPREIHRTLRRMPSADRSKHLLRGAPK